MNTSKTSTKDLMELGVEIEEMIPYTMKILLKELVAEHPETAKKILLQMKRMVNAKNITKDHESTLTKEQLNKLQKSYESCETFNGLVQAYRKITNTKDWGIAQIRLDRLLNDGILIK